MTLSKFIHSKDYTVCIKPRRQTVPVCIKQLKAFVFIFEKPSISKGYSTASAPKIPSYTDYIRGFTYLIIGRNIQIRFKMVKAYFQEEGLVFPAESRPADDFNANTYNSSSVECL